MARKFLTPIDLGKLEIQNVAAQNLASAPSSPVKGQFYMNTTDNTLYWWDGTQWVAAKDAGGSGFPGYGPGGSTVAETAFGQAKADGVATTVARSDHTHGSPTHDAAAHSTIPISALATATGQINMGGFKIGNLGTPSAGSDAATKGYTDQAILDGINGMAWKAPCDFGTTANITLSGQGQTIDGITVVAGYSALVKNQTDQTQNGIYTVQVGAWTRRADNDTTADMEAAATFVRAGTVNGDTQWVQTTNAPTIGSSNIVWAQTAGPGAVTAGAGMTQSGNTLNVVAGDSTITVAADDIRVNTAAIPPNARTITAGNGLTGGGDLSANRTLDVAAADGSIVVTADAIAVGYAGTGGTLGSAVTAARSNHNHDGSYVRTASGTIGAGTSFVINHNLTHRGVVVVVYRSTTPWDVVECDVEHTSNNSVTLRFANAVAANEYSYVVYGQG